MKPRTARAALACLVVPLLTLSACGLPGGHARPDGDGRPSGTTASSEPPTPRPEALAPPVVALQVSHQDGVGPPGWHEWAVAGDVALRTMDRIDFASTVLAWDLSRGLVGSNRYAPRPVNTPAFDSEVGFAQQFDPAIFIALHTDSGAPSGVQALVTRGDRTSGRFAARLTEAISSATGLRDRGVREGKLYSLEPVRNDAPIKVFLKLGDNVQDQEALLDPCIRTSMAEAIASTLLAELGPRAAPGDGRWGRAIQPEAFAGEDPRVVLATDGHGNPPRRSWYSYRAHPGARFHAVRHRGCGASA